jgi:hypothetical protein
LSVALAAGGFAGEAPKDAEPKPPSFAEVEAVVRPMVEGLGLAAEQQAKANGVMNEKTWQTVVAAFDTKRGREIFRAAHDEMRQAMPAVMMPKMMAYNMRKTMKERMARKAGPPTAEEIAAVRAETQKKMKGRVAPVIMSNLEELTAERLKEVLADKKVLIRVLGEKVSEVALTDEQKPKLDKALAAAGSPAALVHGPDPVLIERTKKMIEKVADEIVAKLKEEDAAAQKAPAKNKQAEF